MDAYSQLEIQDLICPWQPFQSTLNIIHWLTHTRCFTNRRLQMRCFRIGKWNNSKMAIGRRFKQVVCWMCRPLELLNLWVRDSFIKHQFFVTYDFDVHLRCWDILNMPCVKRPLIRRSIHHTTNFKSVPF